MKKILLMFSLILACLPCAFAEEVVELKTEDAVQEIEAKENKVIFVIQKQPINEKSTQKVTLKKNWLGVYIQINGKVKVNPVTSTYEVE